jgi:hypothetical protein
MTKFNDNPLKFIFLNWGQVKRLLEEWQVGEKSMVSLERTEMENI